MILIAVGRWSAHSHIAKLIIKLLTNCSGRKPFSGCLFLQFFLLLVIRVTIQAFDYIFSLAEACITLHKQFAVYSMYAAGSYAKKATFLFLTC